MIEAFLLAISAIAGSDDTTLPSSLLDGLWTFSLISLYWPGVNGASTTFSTAPFSSVVPCRSSRNGPALISSSSLSSDSFPLAFSSLRSRITIRMRLTTAPFETVSAFAVAVVDEPAFALKERFEPPQPASSAARATAMEVFIGLPPRVWIQDWTRDRAATVNAPDLRECTRGKRDPQDLQGAPRCAVRRWRALPGWRRGRRRIRSA